MSPKVLSAIETLKMARSLLEAADIKADYSLIVTDTGPGVEVRVSAKSYGLAQATLPFTIGSATVKIVKK